MTWELFTRKKKPYACKHCTKKFAKSFISSGSCDHEWKSQLHANIVLKNLIKDLYDIGALVTKEINYLHAVITDFIKVLYDI